MKNLMKVYKITPDFDCNPHIEADLDSAMQATRTWLTECGDPGQELTIEVLEMTEEDYLNLGEYEGP